MHKYFWIVVVTAALGAGSGYWYLTIKPTDVIPERITIRPVQVLPEVKNDGDAEMSDVIEPIIVDRGSNRGGVQSLEPPTDDGPLARVILEPGMQQPPRPDVEPGRVPRMPYADEEEILALPRDPIARILDVTLPRLDFFDEIDRNPAEESEPPVARPAMDYHQQHCPYHGHCPAPYNYRPMLRN